MGAGRRLAAGRARARARGSRRAPDARIETWTVGRRDAALLDVHGGLFGSEVELVTECPACEAELELAFGVDDIRGACADERALHQVVDPVTGIALEFRVPSSADLLAVVGMSDVAAARAALAERCVARAEADGAPVAPGALPETALAALAARAAELDAQADVELALACAECEHAWSLPFDVADHVWRRLDARARSIVSDVAELAAAYGWTEPEVLRLSPPRRRLYLDLAGA